VSIAATLLVIAMGFPIAYYLARARRPALEAAVLIPLILPPTVVGYFLLVALGRHGPIGQFWHGLTGGQLVFTWYAAAIASSIAASPLFIRQAQVALEGVDHELQSAARSFGASEMQVLWMVTLPLAKRGLIAGVVLAFARGLGEFGATLVVAGSIPGETRTMPLALYSAIETGNDMVATGLTLCLVAVAITVSLIASRFGGQK